MTTPAELAQAITLTQKALAILRTMPPETWALAHAQATRTGLHPTDIGLLGDARLLSLRAGGTLGTRTTNPTTPTPKCEPSK